VFANDFLQAGKFPDIFPERFLLKEGSRVFSAETF
jgi:hypothetical protein